VIHGMAEPQPRVESRQRPPGSRRRVRRGRNRRSSIALGLALAALLAVTGGVGYGVYSVYRNIADRTADYPGPGTGSVVVQVKQGDSVRAMGRRLLAAGVVRSEGAFVAAARREERATSIQPGHYQLRKAMKASEALALLLDPRSRVLARVTIPEGSRLDATLAKLAKESRLPLEQFTSAVRDKALGLPASAAHGAQGFLFPATYDIEPDAKPADVLRQMVLRYDRAAEAVDLEATARKVNLDAYQVVVVASLLEEEAKRPGDFAKVARVIHNRLARGMPLALDSTVNYATGKTGVTTSKQDRAIDSPYNTYRYLGLPPGPINSPGQHALDAALRPAAGSWLYFVTVNPDTGETKFATTFPEHERNVEEFRTWLREH
jgi:UPF0755 protein